MARRRFIAKGGTVGGKDCVSFLHWSLPRLGLAWSGYHRVHRQVCKRLGRRLAALGIGDMAAYRDYLLAHPDEWREVEAACLIPISRFFRDRSVFDALGRDVLPEIAARAAASGRNVIRAWSIGCASGEEPYSLSILWRLGPGRAFPGMSLRILATDAAPHLITRARRGCYGHGSFREFPEAWLDAAFAREEGLYCVRAAFREGISFAEADLTAALPEGPFDLVLCRNVVFTYFTPDRRRAELGRIRSTIAEDGYLVIGRKESLPADARGLVAVDGGGAIYRASSAPPRRIDMPGALVIDGAYGEGGGQILRSALALAAATERAVVIENVRANRPRPGLAAQHLAAVRALAAICDADLEGDHLDSTRVGFAPRSAVKSGTYRFDIGEMRKGGSAGSAMLVVQALTPALACAQGPSYVSVVGGTHLPMSPTFDYGRDVWLDALAAMGLRAELELARWGWYPAGQGEIRLRLDGFGGAGFRPIERIERRALDRLWGRAVVSRLPITIAERMAEHARQVLTSVIEAPVLIAAEVHDAVSPGAGIFLAAAYGPERAGFSALGKRGLPAETVAETAAEQVLAFHRRTAAVDPHLGDQLVLPAALGSGESRYCVAAVTSHLTTMAWLVERFGLATVKIEHGAGGTGLVTVTPAQAGPRPGARAPVRRIPASGPPSRPAG